MRPGPALELRYFALYDRYGRKLRVILRYFALDLKFLPRTILCLRLASKHEEAIAYGCKEQGYAICQGLRWAI